jgi:hypothetical protein
MVVPIEAVKRARLGAVFLNAAGMAAASDPEDNPRDRWLLPQIH